MGYQYMINFIPCKDLGFVFKILKNDDILLKRNGKEMIKQDLCANAHNSVSSLF
jgi:hypothetical protein